MAGMETLTTAQLKALQRGERKQRRSLEYDLHVSFVHFIDSVLPGNLGFHVPNGEKRDKITAAKLKRMGTRPGVADYPLPLPHGKMLWLEFKFPGRKQSKVQKEWAERMRRLGHTVAIIETIDDIRNSFKALGVPTRETA